MKRTLENGDVEEDLNSEYQFDCRVCLSDGNGTSISTYNGVFEHDGICIFCSNDLDWVKEEMLKNGETIKDYKNYEKVRIHNEKLIAKMRSQ